MSVECGLSEAYYGSSAGSVFPAVFMSQFCRVLRFSEARAAYVQIGSYKPLYLIVLAHYCSRKMIQHACEMLTVAKAQILSIQIQGFFIAKA